MDDLTKQLVEALRGLLEEADCFLVASPVSRESARAALAAYEAQAEAKPAPAEPVAWTLQETLDKRETTCSARLWFTNPVNSAWAPLYAAPAPATERERADERADLAERIEAAREASLDDDHRACCAILTECLKMLAFPKVAPMTGPKVAFWVYEWLHPTDGSVTLRSLRPEDHCRKPDRAIPVPLMDEWVKWAQAAPAAPAPDLLRRLTVHGATHHTGADERITCTPEQAALALLDVTGLDVEWVPALPDVPDGYAVVKVRDEAHRKALIADAMGLTAAPAPNCGEFPKLAAGVRAENAKDAERYRWLRDKADYMRVPEGSPQVCLTDEWGNLVSIQPWAYPRGETLDTAVDAAIAASNVAAPAAPAPAAKNLDLFKEAGKWAASMKREITQDMVELLGWLSSSANAWAELVEAKNAAPAAPAPLTDALEKAHEARRQAQSELAYVKARLASARLILMRELKEQGWAPAAPAPAYTEGHCTEKAKPGGCQLHNLHCGYPACDRKPAAPTVKESLTPDPCPGCRPGAVCRTPSCGRLKLRAASKGGGKP